MRRSQRAPSLIVPPRLRKALGDDHLAWILASPNPAGTARSRARGAWDANDPESVGAYDALANLIEHGGKPVPPRPSFSAQWEAYFLGLSDLRGRAWGESEFEWKRKTGQAARTGAAQVWAVFEGQRPPTDAMVSQAAAQLRGDADLYIVAVHVTGDVTRPAWVVVAASSEAEAAAVAQSAVAARYVGDWKVHVARVQKWRPGLLSGGGSRARAKGTPFGYIWLATAGGNLDVYLVRSMKEARQVHNDLRHVMHMAGGRSTLGSVRLRKAANIDREVQITRVGLPFRVKGVHVHDRWLGLQPVPGLRAHV